MGRSIRGSNEDRPRHRALDQPQAMGRDAQGLAGSDSARGTEVPDKWCGTGPASGRRAIRHY